MSPHLDGGQLLSASGLTYTYGSLLALRDISFELRAGELAARVGRNGAGKSTLLRCLAGWTRASGGETLLNGVPLYRVERAARRLLTLVPDTRPFYDDLTPGNTRCWSRGRLVPGLWLSPALLLVAALLARSVFLWPGHTLVASVAGQPPAPSALALCALAGSAVILSAVRDQVFGLVRARKNLVSLGLHGIMSGMARSALPVTALVLAAGLSRRMGNFKLLMPWGERTVVEQVVATLAECGVPGIALVTGHRAAEVAQALSGTSALAIFNPRYAEGEMISSIQAGLAALAEDGDVRAALLCLGDQPQMLPETVRAVTDAGARTAWDRIVIPSYQMRAGHPILLPRWLWPKVLATDSHLNAVLKAHREQTLYVTVHTPTVLADIDTQDDYARACRLESSNGN